MLDSSKLKELAEDNFEFDENGRKFFKRVENTVGKGEITRQEQLLLFPQCFQNCDIYCRHVETRACLGKVSKYIESSFHFQPILNYPVKVT